MPYCSCLGQAALNADLAYSTAHTGLRAAAACRAERRQWSVLGGPGLTQMRRASRSCTAATCAIPGLAPAFRRHAPAHGRRLTGFCRGVLVALGVGLALPARIRQARSVGHKALYASQSRLPAGLAWPNPLPGGATSDAGMPTLSDTRRGQQLPAQPHRRSNQTRARNKVRFLKPPEPTPGLAAAAVAAAPPLPSSRPLTRSQSSRSCPPAA